MTLTTFNLTLIESIDQAGSQDFIFTEAGKMEIFLS